MPEVGGQIYDSPVARAGGLEVEVQGGLNFQITGFLLLTIYLHKWLIHMKKGYVYDL
jgi:hypothetical protein